MNQKNAVLFFVLLLVGGAIIYLEGMKAGVVSSPIGGAREGTGAPELVGIVGYINAEPGLKIADFRGKVVLIDFWTYTCINCIRTLPHLTSWDRKYRDKGLVIIGVHTPEFEFEKERGNVIEAMKKYGVEYRVVQDNDYATWRAFGNRFWPHKYLIDASGVIRYDHIGEGKYEETEEWIQKLLGETGQDVSDMGIGGLEDQTPNTLLSPELYAGYDFALPRRQNVGNDQGLKPGETIDYTLPESRQRNVLYLEGKWMSNADNLRAQDEVSSSIVLDFTASAVNIVADAPAPIKLEVFVGGKYVSEKQAGDDVVFEGEKAFVLVEQPRLYNVVRGEYGRYSLRLTTGEKDFSFNAFTFG